MQTLVRFPGEAHTCFLNMSKRKREVTLKKHLRSEDAVRREKDSDLESWPSAEERLAAVWELTLASIAWGNTENGEPRLQRSICNIQR